MRMTNRLLGALLSLGLAGGAYAAVPAAQADRLGKDLMPVGGEKGANKDNTIPAWEGGITRPPANFKLGDFHPDPFPNDKPVMQLTQANYKDHAAKLSPGQQAMFAKYPTFRMDIYPTRRTASFPQRIYDLSLIHI